MGWWITLGALVVAVLALFGWAWIAVNHDERKQKISWWAARNGFSYGKGSGELLGYLRGAPFDRGTGRDVQDLLVGTWRERPAMIIQFSWYHAPKAGQSETMGISGVRSGVCAAAVLELPAVLPELTVRRETATDLVRGRDLQLESEEFNRAFRIGGSVDKFVYDVLNPRLMAWLLADPRSAVYTMRIAGPMLVVWRDGKITKAVELGELAAYAGDIYDRIPGFVYGEPWPPPARAALPISQIPESALGDSPKGAVHALRKVHHRGHDIELFEHDRGGGHGGGGWAIVASLPVVPFAWPNLSIVPRGTHIHDPALGVKAIPSGDPEFDQRFSAATNRPEFAEALLTPALTHLFVTDPRLHSMAVVFRDELLTPEDDGVPTRIERGILCIVADGRLNDPAATTAALDLVCDLRARIPEAATHIAL